MFFYLFVMMVMMIKSYKFHVPSPRSQITSKKSFIQKKCKKKKVQFFLTSFEKIKKVKK